MDRIVVRVLDVDLEQRIAHCEDKTGASVLCSIRDTGGAVYRVPMPQEQWTATRIDYIWYIENKIDTAEEHAQVVAEMAAGDTRVDASGTLWFRATSLNLNGMALGAMESISLAANGTNKVFTLNNPPVSWDTIQAFMNGLLIDPRLFSINEGTLTFQTAPAAGSLVVYYQRMQSAFHDSAIISGHAFISGLETLALILSGNEITDATRTTNTQGDGRSNDSSFGIYEATTNMLTNGSFETNLTGWGQYGNADGRTRDTAVGKFGTASMKITRPVIAGTNGTGSDQVTVVAGQTWTASVWIKPGTAPLAQIQVSLEEVVGGTGAWGATLVQTVGDWYRYAATVVIAAGVTAVRMIVYHTGTTPADDGETFWLDGAQIEQQPLATPYAHTDGATATRAAALVQARATLISTTQAWVAQRVRLPYGQPIPDGRRGLFEWMTGGDAILAQLGDTAIHVYKNGLHNLSLAWVAGAELTIVTAWTAAHIKISVNGAAFTTFANTSIPAIVATTFQIGGGTGVGAAQRELDGEILWTVCGIGTLTDADAEKLNVLGATDPTAQTLPAAADMTGIWTAQNSTLLLV